MAFRCIYRIAAVLCCYIFESILSYSITIGNCFRRNCGTPPRLCQKYIFMNCSHCAALVCCVRAIFLFFLSTYFVGVVCLFRWLPLAAHSFPADFDFHDKQFNLHSKWKFVYNGFGLCSFRFSCACVLILFSYIAHTMHVRVWQQ